MKQRLAQIWRRFANFWISRIIRWRSRIVVFARRVQAWPWAPLRVSAVSLFSFVMGALILIVPEFRTTVDNFQPLEAVLSQLAATYGTILALVLTLSIIPIQRAAEVWSPSIVRLYRRDPVIKVIFVVLGVCCVASFFLAIRGLFPAPVSVVMALSLAALGFNLDILRWYHSYLCRLLDPVHAVNLVLKKTKQAIDRAKTQVTRNSQRLYKLLDAEQKGEMSIAAIEPTIYSRMMIEYHNRLNSWINDLVEIGLKAVDSREKLLAKTIVSAISDLTKYYLSSRKLNLTLNPVSAAMLPAMTSDVSIVMNRAYEALHELSRVAVTQGDEATAIHVIEAYQAIAIHTAHLGAPAFRQRTAPLTFGPIHYAFECIKYAQSKGIDEVVYQSAGILSKVAATAPKDIDKTDIHVPVIDYLTEIAKYLYGQSSYGIAEEVNGYQFSILAQLLQRKDYNFKDVLRYVMGKMEMLASLAIESGTMAGRLSTVHPLWKAYGLISQDSLSYLFEQAAATLSKQEVTLRGIHPYHDLIDIADIISDHLRRLAENCEFGESFLLWEIDQSIRHISRVISKIVDQPSRMIHGDETKLVDKLLWVLAFYWVAFDKKKTVSGRRADDCCESLLCIGLKFLEQEHPEVLRTCISNIRSIVESYCEIAKPPEAYTIGDLLAHLWGIRMVLVARHKDSLTQEVDHALTTKPQGLTDEQWHATQKAIIRRREQLEERLAQRENHLGDPDSSELLLRRLLLEPPTQAR